MARTSAGGNGNLAFHRSVSANQSVIIAAHCFELLGVGEKNSFQHFLDEFDRTVQDFLHGDPFVISQIVTQL